MSITTVTTMRMAAAAQQLIARLISNEQEYVINFKGENE
jgi:hypothetical protein